MLFICEFSAVSKFLNLIILKEVSVFFIEDKHDSLNKFFSQSNILIFGNNKHSFNTFKHESIVLKSLSSSLLLL